jgi:hypothetical protein
MRKLGPLNRTVEWVCVRTFPWRTTAEVYVQELRRQRIHALVTPEERALDATPASRVMVPISEQLRAEMIDSVVYIAPG